MGKNEKSVGNAKFLFDTLETMSRSVVDESPLAVSPYLNLPLRSLEEARADLQNEAMRRRAISSNSESKFAASAKADDRLHADKNNAQGVATDAAKRIGSTVFDCQARQIRGLNNANEPKREHEPIRRVVNQ